MQEMWEWRIHVQGSVQGVGFRAAIARHARQHQIVGYVRNCQDGAVEICVQGSQAALEAFLETVRLQPGSGSVDQFKIDRHRPSAHFSSFEVRL